MMDRSLRAKRIKWKGEVSTMEEAKSSMISAGDTVVVKRGVPRSLVMKCPSGCGDELVINLDKRVGPAWRYYERRGKLTLYPSIWRESGCKSHFIVWNNAISWCDWESLEETEQSDQLLDEKILKALPVSKWTHFSELADVLDELPWTVSMRCWRLAHNGMALAGTGKWKDHYRRSKIKLEKVRKKRP